MKNSKKTILAYLQDEQSEAGDHLRAYENRLREKHGDEDTKRRSEVQAILTKDRIAQLSQYIRNIKKNF